MQHALSNSWPLFLMATVLTIPGTVAGLAGVALGLSPLRALILGLAAGGSPLFALLLLLALYILSALRAERAVHVQGQWQPEPFWREMLHFTYRQALPELRELRYVAGIGAVRELNGSRLSLLSLEAYADGFALLGHVQSPLPEAPPEERRQFRDAAFVFEVRDDRGGVYRVLPFGGGPGSGTRNGITERRFRWAGMPALDERSGELQIVVERLRWVQFRAMPDHGLSYEIELPPGGWRFTVPLTGR